MFENFADVASDSNSLFLLRFGRLVGDAHCHYQVSRLQVQLNVNRLILRSNVHLL